MLQNADRRLLTVGVLLFLGCVLLRAAGSWWGLPSEDRLFSLHPDEPVVLSYSQQIDPVRGDLTPGFYNYGTFYLTSLRFATDIASTYGGLTDESPLWRTMFVAHLAGRWINILAGAGIAVVVLAILWRRTHFFGAILGALAAGITPALVMHSRFQTVDVLATFLLTLSLWQATKLFPVKGEQITAKAFTKAAILSGVFAGLSAGTKYTGILALAATVIACYLAVRTRDAEGAVTSATDPSTAASQVEETRAPESLVWWKPAVIAVVVGLMAFLIATPGMLLEPGQFWKDFVYEMNHTSTGHGLVFAGTSPGFIYHLASLSEGYGGLLLLLSLAASGWAVRSRQYWLIGPLVFALLTYLLIGRAEVKFVRYTFPLIPVLAVAFGWAVGTAHKQQKTWSRVAVAAAILSLGGMRGGAVGTMRATVWMMETDPRDAVGRFLQKEPAGTTVGLVRDPWFWTPTLYPEVGYGPWAGDPVRFEAMDASTSPRVLRYRPEDGSERLDWDERLLDLQPDYVVMTSFEYEGYSRVSMPGYRGPYAEEGERYAAFLERLDSEYEIESDAGMGGSALHDMMYVRPAVYVWKKKTPSTSPSTNTSTSSSLNEEPPTAR